MRCHISFQPLNKCISYETPWISSRWSQAPPWLPSFPWWHPLLVECFNPQEIRLPDGRLQVVRCGKCLACLSHRQAEWITRLRVALEVAPGTSYFVTLTYDEAHLPTNVDKTVDLSEVDQFPLVPTVRKRDLQKFHMDLRKRFQQGFYYDDTLGYPVRIELPQDIKFRYYCTSEYGPQGHRPHYHGLYTKLPEDRDLVFDLFNKIWNKGFIYCEPAETEKAAAYVAKYLVNTSLVPIPPAADRPFALMSKGLGLEYLSQQRIEWHRAAHKMRNYVPVQDRRQVLPRYFRDRIFDDAMKADILDDCLDREAALDDQLAAMSVSEFTQYMCDKHNREQEAVRQAEWRFRKNGKIK